MSESFLILIPSDLFARLFRDGSIDYGWRTDDWKLVEMVLCLDAIEFLSPLD
jgi:hypothetical protein